MAAEYAAPSHTTGRIREGKGALFEVLCAFAWPCRPDLKVPGVDRIAWSRYPVMDVVFLVNFFCSVIVRNRAKSLNYQRLNFRFQMRFF